MDGAAHYRRADLLLDMALDQASEPRALMLAHAQVHATLALAAATAYPAVRDYRGDEDPRVAREWADVAAP